MLKCIASGSRRKNGILLLEMSAIFCVKLRLIYERAGGDGVDYNEAIEEWFALYEKDIATYLAYYTGTTDVEDYVQETFLKAYRKMDSYRAAANPKTWLIAIARNVAKDAFRKNSRQSSFLSHFSLHPDGAEAGESIEKHLLVKEDQRDLYHAILELRKPYREVLHVKGIMELSSKESAEILGWSISKVNVTFSRALKKLKTVMEGNGYGKETI